MYTIEPELDELCGDDSSQSGLPRMASQLQLFYPPVRMQLCPKVTSPKNTHLLHCRSQTMLASHRKYEEEYCRNFDP